MVRRAAAAAVVVAGTMALVLLAAATTGGNAALNATLEAADGSPAALPPRILWAWERPEDLRFLDPESHGAAVLLATVYFAADATHGHGAPGHGVTVHPRRQPLSLPAALPLLAVTRIEAAPGARLGAEQRRRTVAAVLATLDGPLLRRAAGVQIDFDARLSERPFYAALLADLRRRLDDLPAPRRRLEITALASWCLGDPWLDDLPVDDAVPMLFRMGVDDAAVRRHLAAGGDFASPLCRSSLGLSSDEPWPRLPAGRRLYVFRPAPWTAAAWAAVGAPPIHAASGASP